MIGKFYLSLPILALPVITLAEQSSGNLSNGKVLFEDCSVCHQIGAAAENTAGPILNHIVDQKAANVEGFEYSEALIKKADEGLIWTPENLDAFLASPDEFVPETIMPYGGIESAEDRRDIIAYLSSISGDETADEVGEGFSVAPEILALQGDRAYGEYLSSECVTCHQAGGEDDGIPNITGWKAEEFVTVMHAYRSKYRDNSVMQLVAGRLSDEEIAALAAYFENPE